MTTRTSTLVADGVTTAYLRELSTGRPAPATSRGTRSASRRRVLAHRRPARSARAGRRPGARATAAAAG